MVYTQVYQGVTFTCNVPFDQPLPDGAPVIIDLHFNTPIADLATLGYDLLTIFGQATFQSQLIQAGWNGQITDYNVFTLDAYTQRIAFIVPVSVASVGTTSFVVGQPVRAFIAPIAFAYIGIAAAAILIAAGITYFIVTGAMVLAGAAAASVPYLVPLVGLVAAVGVGAFLYDFLKGGRDFRRRVYRETGRAGKQAARGGVRLAEKGVSAAAHGVAGLAHVGISRAQADTEARREASLERMRIRAESRRPRSRDAGAGIG